MSIEASARARLNYPEPYLSQTVLTPEPVPCQHRALTRHAAYLLTAMALTVSLAVSLASVTFAAGATATPTNHLVVAGDSPTTVSGMMPGDTRTVRQIELRAEGPMRYQMRASCTGSQELAQSLLVVFTAADGSTLYRGPWAGASVGGPTLPSADDPFLADGQADTVTITATLALDAAPELAGAAVECAVIVSSYPDAA